MELNNRALPGDPNLPLDIRALQNHIQTTYPTKSEIGAYSCEVVGEGKGFMSVVTKVSVEWIGNLTDNEAPSEIVIKKPTGEKLQDMKLHGDRINQESVSRMHNTEVSAYQYFMLGEKPPVPICRPILLQKCAQNQDGLIILDFSKGQSIGFGEPMTKAQMKTVLGNIASVQAYGLQQGKLLEYFSAMPDAFLPMSDFIHNLEESIQKINKAWPESCKIDPILLGKLINQAEKVNYRLRNIQALGRSACLCIGDLQPNNLLWKLEEDGALSDKLAAWLDFQICHIGSSAFDAATVMLSNLDTEDRQSCQNELLVYFQDRLREMAGKTILNAKELRGEYADIMLMMSLAYISFVGMRMEEGKPIQNAPRKQKFVEKAMAVITEFNHCL